MPDVLRLSIEIGHIATEPDTSPHCSQGALTDEQIAILTALDCSVRTAWVQEVMISVDDTSTDHWVAEELEDAINAKLAPGMPAVKIKSDHVVRVDWPGLKPTAAGEGGTSPDPNTQCRLVGHRWVNTRTYYLHAEGGGRWLFEEWGGKHVAIATLTWQCRTLRDCKPGGSAMPAFP